MRAHVHGLGVTPPVPAAPTPSGPILWNAQRILSSLDARAAISSLGHTLRHAGFTSRDARVAARDDELLALGLGHPAPFDVATRALGGTRPLDALVAAGGAHRQADGAFVLRFEVLSGARAFGVLPHQGPWSPWRQESVYAGSDTWLLLERTWQFALGGRRAVELGCGTGLTATFLARRYERVVAADVSRACVGTAALSRALCSEAVAGRLDVAAADVGAGLRHESFDFVAVNPPWVPTCASDDNRYADGGPTGFELPRRFLLEGSKLLAPGGVLVALCADLRFSGNRAPVMEALGELERRGLTTRMVPTPREHPCFSVTHGSRGLLPGLEAARHVTVVAHRP